MIIKCKMCGGDLEFIPGATYGTCEYCGSTSTIPQADDESKLNRYNRANHFRRQCEFDKAVTAYEKLLEQDDTDAEAHWGAVISRYGIEYVEDPLTKRRIPTCHRVQVASILVDADYLAAVEYAPDDASRNLYKEQAAEIAEIQKGILAISANEKPYDVFICYKESDANGQRTRDSALAQDVYYGLTEQGYKVFFSRITLEDKLGQQYEPYIFAALNSARVMVVIGTKPEYFNAVWVKNEWSRYIELMKSDRSRLLIPCYRDMDPYDLPEELSNLQSQDMGKIGFIQDLIRGVKKVLENNSSIVSEKNHGTGNAGPSLVPGFQSLMERAEMFLEDGDFTSTIEYCNRVLDLNPKYAQAYLIKACAEFGFRCVDDLAKATFVYEQHPDWQKVIRFTVPDQLGKYEDFIAQVKERVNHQINLFICDCAVELAVDSQTEMARLQAEIETYKKSCFSYGTNRANGNRRKNAVGNLTQLQKAMAELEPGNVSEQNYQNAIAMVANIEDELAVSISSMCTQLAQEAHNKACYAEAKRIMGLRIGDSAKSAAEIFASIIPYKDSQEKYDLCIAISDKETQLASILAGENGSDLAAQEYEIEQLREQRRTVSNELSDVSGFNVIKKNKLQNRYREISNAIRDLEQKVEEHKKQMTDKTERLKLDISFAYQHFR